MRVTERTMTACTGPQTVLSTRQKKQARTATGYMVHPNRKAAAVILAAAMLITACGSGREYTDQADALIENGEYAKALETLDVAENSGEDMRLVHRSRGIADMGLSDYEAAETEFVQSLSSNKGYVREMDLDTSYYLAISQYRLGKVKDANATYSAILALYPKESDAYYLRGRTYLALQDNDNAKSDFDKAIRISPDDPDLYIQIYEALSEAGLSDDGQRYLKNAMELNTKLSYFQKGRLYYCMEEYDKAKQSLEAAVTEGGDSQASLYLGRTYEALGDMNYAASLYREYLETDPGNAQVLNQLGLCLMNLEDYPAALDAFSKGLETGDPAMDQSLRFNQVAAYEYMGDFTKARNLMEDYMEKYPDDQEAQRENEFLSTR
ncbi:MAG TPA: hypothetical protein DIS68_04580 [Lachnospiraceae bacterium]|nr:hypothetical protein [Lachnospiraceae bacterium]HCS00071.1 hypothetical protein [Lachnospiraceae bacterium]